MGHLVQDSEYENDERLYEWIRCETNYARPSHNKRLTKIVGCHGLKEYEKSGNKDEPDILSWKKDNLN